MLNEIIITYALTDDLLTAMGHDAAGAKGATEVDILSRITCQGLWLTVVVSLAAMILMWNSHLSSTFKSFRSTEISQLLYCTGVNIL